MTLFDAAICTIFAREFMEGAIIIGEYRTAILHSDLPATRQEVDDEEDADPKKTSKQELLRTVTVWAAIASALAVAIVLIVAIPLAVLSKNFDKKVAEIIEGISKVVAAFCILQLSCKIPKWLGFYKNRKGGKVSEGFDMSVNSIRFNVGWNIWREMAECGVFLLPSFLTGDDLEAIPISALVGIIVGLGVGLIIYAANRRLNNKLYLCCFITLLLIFLSTGLMVGGVHEFEEVWGETKVVWTIGAKALNSKQLPMALVKPFGYSHYRTVLMMVTFWSWLLLAACCHYCMYRRTQNILSEQQKQVEFASDDSLVKVEAGTGDVTRSPSTSEKLSDGEVDVEDGQKVSDGEVDGDEGHLSS